MICAVIGCILYTIQIRIAITIPLANQTHPVAIAAPSIPMIGISHWFIKIPTTIEQKFSINDR